jgi:hypothetical protein
MVLGWKKLTGCCQGVIEFVCLFVSEIYMISKNDFFGHERYPMCCLLTYEDKLPVIAEVWQNPEIRVEMVKHKEIYDNLFFWRIDEKARDERM